MPPKGSSLTQTTLSFGSSKPSAVAAKTKKAAGTTRSAGKKANTVTTIDISSSEDEEEQRNLDDIQEPQPPSDSETEDGTEQHSDEKRPDGSRILRSTSTKAEKSTTAVSKAKPKTATHETVKAAESAVKSKVSAEKAEVESRPHLNVKDPAYSRLFAEARQKNGYLPTVHPKEGENRIHEILRVFDLSYEYGPTAGMTRLERWQRAKALKLNPPQEIYDILTTQEGIIRPDYRDNVLAGEV